jgi:hypothetical protein
VSLWSSTTSISRASAGSLTALLSKIHSFFLFSDCGSTLERRVHVGTQVRRGARHAFTKTHPRVPAMRAGGPAMRLQH